ncbi:MAG: HAD family hydrolase [Planctomycetes bacterium]|nr:HAD family hydrolase [Planctomycetota bacterium]
MPTVTRDRYDALVFDLDGTLLDGEGRLAPATKDAVDRVRALGYLVVLATGRSAHGTAEVHRTLGLDTEMVAYNGAWIGHDADGEPWHCATIPDDLVGRLDAVESRAAFLFRHHRDAKLTPRTAHPEHERVTRWYTNAVLVDAAAPALPTRDLLRVSLFFDDAARTDAAWAALEDDVRARLHREVFPMSLFPEFRDTGLVLCELQRRGRGKAEALRLLAERYGVPAARVVAFGDQANDLPLLSEVGLAVAMGNAIEPAKAVADLVIGPHDTDGVARFLGAEVG